MKLKKKTNILEEIFGNFYNDGNGHMKIRSGAGA